MKCEEHTQEALLKTLVKDLHEALEVEEEAWDKQIEEDAKAGRLDRFAEKALENFRAGRYYEIEDLFKKVGNLWAIRICKGYRALAHREEGNFIWRWIGTHDEYMRRIRES